MTIDELVFIFSVTEFNRMVEFFQCPMCGSAVAELNHGTSARQQHIKWHEKGGH